MNVLDKSASRNCTSCGVCATICTRKAISIKLNKEGFYRPIVNESLCNDCALCTSICYKFDKEVLMTAPGGLDEKPLYSAWANNDELVKQTTSGGIGDLLARQLQKEGYIVVGVIYNEEKARAEHKTAKNQEDLCGFRGSKYIQSYTFDAFKDVVENSRNEKYAVFGTPCQIYALNRLATKRKVRDNFYFVDLYCHGCPSLHAWTKYQARLKKQVGVDKFDQVIFRSKLKGWGSFYVVVVVKDGKPVFIGDKVKDDFYELFFSNYILNEACHDCKLRSTLEYTDIRIGDFWGHKYLNNQRGVSAVSISTNKGKDLFKAIKNEIVCLQCSYDEFLKYQSWGRVYEVDPTIRSAIISSLSNPDNDLKETIAFLRRCQGLTTAIKRNIKIILALFPLGLTNGIKKIVYKLRN